MVPLWFPGRSKVAVVPVSSVDQPLQAVPGLSPAGKSVRKASDFTTGYWAKIP